MEPVPSPAQKKDLWEQLRENPREALLAKARRAASLLRARVVLRGCKMGKGVSATGHVQVIGTSGISLHDRVTLLGGMIPTQLSSGSGATLSIGEETLLNYGCVLEAHQRIHIGQRCMLASFVRVSDKGPQGTAPVTIGDDVWIAHGALIEPGVTIGNGSVVSAGSVVTKDVPPNSMAIGNPARVMPLSAMSRE